MNLVFNKSKWMYFRLLLNQRCERDSKIFFALVLKHCFEMKLVNMKWACNHIEVLVESKIGYQVVTERTWVLVESKIGFQVVTERTWVDRIPYYQTHSRNPRPFLHLKLFVRVFQTIDNVLSTLPLSYLILMFICYSIVGDIKKEFLIYCQV